MNEEAIEQYIHDVSINDINHMSKLTTQTERFFFWLFHFGILPPEKGDWLPILKDIYESHRETAMSGDPLAKFTEEQRTVIEVDLDRSIYWFNECADEIGLGREYKAQGMILIKRIFGEFLASNADFKYFQGYDRYVIVSLLLCLQFAERSRSSPDFAEAMAFILSASWILLVNVPYIYQNCQSHFEDLDESIKSMFPSIWNSISSLNVTTIHFVLKWEVVLFSDQHNIHDIFKIWDYFVFYRQDFQEALKAMDISHITAIDFSSIDNIFHYDGWNANSVIDGAIDLMDEPIFERVMEPLSAIAEKILKWFPFCRGCTGPNAERIDALINE